MLNKEIFSLADKLYDKEKLSFEEYLHIITTADDEDAAYLAKKAVIKRKEYYKNEVFIRGLIEISNICKNDCYYCGIRKSNKNCERYRLSEKQIKECCRDGYSLGFRTFVLQGGEDGYFSDDVLVPLISDIKTEFPDCAVTLSLGERSFESFLRLKNAGADRYLLRHETCDELHYSKLHPPALSHKKRLLCLESLKKLGFQTGCGFMVGSPHQTPEMLARELLFIEEFKPHMCGIGPFIPHKDTCFKNHPAGSVWLTCLLISLVRLISPKILLPSTTALGTLDKKGREKGILSGANVVMPNLSPKDVRKKYELYNNKLSDGAESASSTNELKRRIESIGYKIPASRGDFYTE